MSIITCPSGLSGEVRQLRVAEERILTDRRLHKTGQVVDQLLRACWVSTIAPGPYEATDPVNWSRVLQGDRMYALIQVRAETYGADFEFRCSCTECKARFGYKINLLEDLSVQPLSDESRRIFTAGNRFEAALRGQRVVFRLLVGADEHALANIRRQSREEALSSQMAYKILEIEGIEAAQKKAWIKDLGLGDIRDLTAAFDAVDCGVDTDVEIECPECEAGLDISLPFDQGFLMPKAKKAS